MQAHWQSQRQAAIRYPGHCQVHQNPFSLLLPRAPTSLDCILSLNCDVAHFADQPGQMQPGHQFSDDVVVQPEQGSSDVFALKVNLMICICSSCSIYTSSSPLSLRKVSKLFRAMSACLLVNCMTFYCHSNSTWACCIAGFTEDHAFSMEAERMLDDVHPDQQLQQPLLSTPVRYIFFIYVKVITLFTVIAQPLIASQLRTKTRTIKASC